MNNTAPSILLAAFFMICGCAPEASVPGMSIEQKVSRLIMVSSLDTNAASYASKYGVGGMIVMDRDSASGFESIRRFKDSSAVFSADLKPLIAMDAEWGAGMRFRDLDRFPYARTLSALGDSAVREVSGLIAAQVSSYGIDINFAPVVDVDTNEDNPVIGRRSFSRDPLRVADCARIFVNEHRKAGVICCAKHFPGHGDTSVDSHKGLPTILWDRERLDSVELFPFRSLIDDGIEMIMVGHLSVPSLDSTLAPASISPLITKNFLRDSLGFKGVIITDALNMRGVLDVCPEDSAMTQSAKAALLAYKAGADMLLMPSDVLGAINSISSAIRSGELSESDLDERLQRVLSLTCASSR